MKFSSALISLAAAGLVQAGPVAKRGDITDADILQYALTLEHLEASFYEQGLKNYTQSDFMAAGFKDSAFFTNIKMVAEDEKAHEDFLTKALSAAGVKPVERCTYSFPATDVKSFLAVGSMLEGVGVSAYLGAAAHIMNATYLSAAGSILTVEARHSAYLRAAQGEAPAAQPFDNPLDFNEVYTVASPFIASCPDSNMMLPVKAFPSLMMTGGKAMTGSMVQLMAGEGFEKMNAKDVHAAFITATGPVWASIQDKGNGKFMVTVPKGVMGQSYVVLTRGDKQATDDNIVAGPAIIEVSDMMKSGDMGMGSSSMMMPMPTPSASMSEWMPSASGSMAMPSGWMPMASGSMTPSASMSSPSSLFTGAAAKNSMSGAFGAGMGISALFAAMMV